MSLRPHKLHRCFSSQRLKNVLCKQQIRNTSKSSVYDVVVSGGGMVGNAMAASLCKRLGNTGLQVLVLEGGPNKGYSLPLQFSNRVVALNPTSVELLKETGAWNHIESARYHQVKRMQVWDSCSDSLITFANDDINDSLAYIVENDLISSALLKELEDMPDTASVRFNSKVKKYRLPKKARRQSDDGKEDSRLVEVVLENGDKISCKLLIGADGHNSLVRQTAGFRTYDHSYNQNAVVAVLRLHDETKNTIAWQRFLKTGPIAMLPLSPSHSCLIWSTSKSQAKKLMALDSENFVDAVNQAFYSDDDKNPTVDYASELLDGLISRVGLDGGSQQQLPPHITHLEADSRASFPLGLCHSSHYVRSRVALVGDSAHRIHPLAGQGVNLGFADVSCLSEKLVESVHNGADIGALSTLLSYETERQRRVVPVMGVLHALHHLYGTNWLPVVLVRSLGLQLTNAARPVKSFLMRMASSS